ncbi:hypothetical protein [Myceligenerans crystallogenes]|uniref:Phosphotransferase enzyme family protein n=1 Tax=Myceligenerans crystallogenes TaxID=316335 RepID=A0ABN2NC16_9MICO
MTIAAPPDSLATPQIDRIVRTGSSGAVVVLVNIGGAMRAVKTSHRPRVTAAQQAHARALIAQWFPGRLPEVLFAGPAHNRDVLVTRCPSPDTLADLTATDPTTALDVWSDIVDHLTEVWQASARQGFDPRAATRSHATRWERGRAGLQWSLAQVGVGSIAGRRLVVNDVDLGNLDALLQRLRNFPLPRARVACQGDPQPRNVLVDQNHRWHLIDWEWAGTHHDWRMLVSHLLGWWQIETLLATAHGTITTTPRGDLSVAYEQPDDGSERAFASGARAFDTMTATADRDRDLTALARHLAMLHLREIPKVARTMPWRVAPLLGQAAHLAAGPTDDLLQLLTPSKTDRRPR